jgi:hypothetical protein
MSEPIFMELGAYIMTPEPIPTAYFINSSHQFVCPCVYPNVVRQLLGKTRYRGNEFTRNNTVVGRVMFYAVRVG